MKNHHISKIAGLSLAALLALTACGGGDDETPEPQSNGGGQEQTAEEPEAYVYDFEQAKAGSDAESYHVPGGEAVTVQLSNELAAVLPEENSVPVQSYTLTARSFEATGVCVLEAEIAYEPDEEETAEAMIEEAGEGNASRVYIRRGPNIEMVDALPSDDELEEHTAYLLSDLSSLIVVAECSDDPEDQMFTLMMMEQHSQESGPNSFSDNNRNFAEVDVAVQPDGAITLFSPSVDGADVSASGKWAYKELNRSDAVDEMEGIDDF